MSCLLLYCKGQSGREPSYGGHWSCIVQPAGKRSIIRYFCNDFSLQFGKCKIASEEKFRTILEADGSRIELMQTGNGWEDYKEKRYGLYYPSKRDVPYDMFLYGNVKAILKIPVYEHSMLDVWAVSYTHLTLPTICSV